MSEPPFWLDADVLIQSKNGVLDFDLAPGLWEWFEEQADRRIVLSPMMVHDEIIDYGDELSSWAKNMKARLFVDASSAVQRAATPILEFVKTNYPAKNCRDFLSGADPWIIAHAQESSGTVVAHEKRLDPKCRTPKIPNLCDVFGVECISLRDLAKLLGNLKLRRA